MKVITLRQECRFYPLSPPLLSVATAHNKLVPCDLIGRAVVVRFRLFQLKLDVLNIELDQASFGFLRYVKVNGETTNRTIVPTLYTLSTSHLWSVPLSTTIIPFIRSSLPFHSRSTVCLLFLLLTVRFPH